MLYDLAIAIYDILVHLAAPFSRKPRKMMKGHWVVYELLRQQLEKDVRYIWFHAASLGEFEQGRPLIEKIRAKYPDYGILLTFFSPSGYEVRKNYRGADVVCYLPFDKSRNVKKFLDIVNPCMAFFIKYEFWKNYLDELHKRRIPVYSISSIFRRGQVFFKWYGAHDYGRLFNGLPDGRRGDSILGGGEDGIFERLLKRSVFHLIARCLHICDVV